MFFFPLKYWSINKVTQVNDDDERSLKRIKNPFQKDFIKNEAAMSSKQMRNSHYCLYNYCLIGPSA